MPQLTKEEIKELKKVKLIFLEDIYDILKEINENLLKMNHHFLHQDLLKMNHNKITERGKFE